MSKSLKNKYDESEALRKQVEEFQAKGGVIYQGEIGESAIDSKDSYKTTQKKLKEKLALN